MKLTVYSSEVTYWKAIRQLRITLHDGRTFKVNVNKIPFLTDKTDEFIVNGYSTLNNTALGWINGGLSIAYLISQAEQ